MKIASFSCEQLNCTRYPIHSSHTHFSILNRETGPAIVYQDAHLCNRIEENLSNAGTNK